MQHSLHPARISRPAFCRPAFTLVELLVVIGIIALLISVLLPALNRARQAGNDLKCLSNIRQLTTAAMMHATEHDGYFPSSSDPGITAGSDPARRRYIYIENATGGTEPADWASSLIPYLGGKTGQSFVAAKKQGEIFICPLDRWQDHPSPGYLFERRTVSPPREQYYRAISYGINADVTAVISRTTNPGHSMFTSTNWINVRYGPTQLGQDARFGAGVGGKQSKIQKASAVLLFADCGVRPASPSPPSYALDSKDSLYYTSNSNPIDGTLATTFVSPMNNWLGHRVPLDRHRNRINIGFADGHGETVRFADFKQVRLSPWLPKSP
jgi:prepilin-type N-terminal cleavage/methylation domain-containing protein/prepilin-type processing-associated H-X9-DG protein